MDTVRVRMILDYSTTEHWPFTRLARELKRAGVALYRLNIMSGDMEFLDNQGRAVYEAHPVRRRREVAPTLCIEKISLQFRHFMHSDTTLPDMVTVLAEAGVQFFEVDLLEGSCSFHGNAQHLTNQETLDAGIQPPASHSPAILPLLPGKATSGRDPEVGTDSGR